MAASEKQPAGQPEISFLLTRPGQRDNLGQVPDEAPEGITTLTSRCPTTHHVYTTNKSLSPQG